MDAERIEIEGVPTNVYSSPNSAALLLLGHGGGHSKDGPRFDRLCRTYAERTGLAVVCIDAVDHGERKRPSAPGEIPAHWHSENVDRMVQDWHKVASSLDSIGPPVAYVGFSMGAIFGMPTVGAMHSIQAAVFVAGGIPTGGGIDDPALRSLLIDSASQLTHPHVLMLNKTQDSIFAVGDVTMLFDAIPSTTKRLAFSQGDHDHWPDELIDESVEFLHRHVTADA